MLGAVQNDAHDLVRMQGLDGLQQIVPGGLASADYHDGLVYLLSQDQRVRGGENRRGVQNSFYNTPRYWPMRTSSLSNLLSKCQRPYSSSLMSPPA